MARQGIDHHDRDILRWLRKDARMPISQIAEKLELSNTACRARVKKLEKLGYIKAYTTLIANPKYTDFEYALIGLKAKSKAATDEMCDFLCSIPNLVMLDLIEGKHDLLAKFGIASNSEYNQIREKIRGHSLCELIESIYSTETIRGDGETNIDQLT